jgi:hypothetical protein
MTRKDYILLAAAVRRVRDGYGTNWNPNLFRAVDDIAISLGAALLRDNPRFDRVRFLTACGVPEEKHHY